MDDETTATTTSEKGIWEKAKDLIVNSWKYVIGSGAFLTAAIRYQDLFDWIKTMEILHLPLTTKIILGVLTLAGVIFAIVYMKKNTQAPNYAIGSFVVAIFCGALLAMQQDRRIDNIIIVYDEHTETFHPEEAFVNVSSKKLRDISKLTQANHITSNTILVSTFDRPVVRWKEVLKDSRINSPILSLQEKLKESESGIIEIPFSTFENDISNVFKKNSVYDKLEIEIFWEYGYLEAEKRLKESLKEKNSAVIIHSHIYDETSFKKLLNPKSAVIFLGSGKSLNSFLEKSTKDDYKLLVVPNWLRPNLEPMDANNSSNRICMVSNTLHRLSNSDPNAWGIIFKSIKSDWSNGEQLKDKVLSNFADNNPILKINF